MECRLLQKNFPSSPAFSVDLSTCSGKQLRKLAGLPSSSQVDVLFGGPPCQGFSVGGRREVDDERNLLIFEFARLVREIRPKYFVMENVAGLLQSRAQLARESFLRRVKRSGYQIVEPLRILNAADFGVPQRRHRTFILGYLRGVTPLFYPMRRGCQNEAGEEFFPTVSDAISDLVELEKDTDLFDVDVHTGSFKPRSSYSKLLRGEYRLRGDRSAKRKWNKGSLSGCLRSRHDSLIQRRFAKTKPGEAEPISRYFRLRLNQVSPTIRAGTGADRGSHTAPRPIHPTMPRCITAREAARLHSFPDWFAFYGTRWHDFRQIGNSVPPLFAKAVADVVYGACEQTKSNGGSRGK